MSAGCIFLSPLHFPSLPIRTPHVKALLSFILSLLLRPALPPNPRPTHHPPNPHLATLQIRHPIPLLLNLGMPDLAHLLPLLLPHPNLLLRAVPIRHHGDMVRLANVHAIFGVQAALVAGELGVTECDDIARTDLVELLGGGIGEVRVDGGAIGAGADGEEDGGR